MTTDPKQPELRISVQTDQYSLAPGDKLDIAFTLTNEGSAPDQVRISVEGIPLVWISAEQQVVLLQPGEQAQITLNVHPPAPPNARAGRYRLQLRLTSTIDPARIVETAINLTIAAYEAKGRVGVLMEAVQFTAIPGEQLTIPIVLVNRGLTPDTFQLGQSGFPQEWITSLTPALHLNAGEETTVFLAIQPPRLPGSRAGRLAFTILVGSQEAPDQSASIDCVLTVSPFTEFKSSLVAAQPEQNLPRRVVVQNLSNLPVTFRVTWSSPEDTVTFEPAEPQQINVPSGETVSVEYTAQPTRRPWFGGELSFPYTIDVQASDGQLQKLESGLESRALIPVWVIPLTLLVLLLLCVLVGGLAIIPGMREAAPPTALPTASMTATNPAPTATRSQIDQRPLLIERQWYLVAYNDRKSQPGMQEAFTLFNPNGTLIGYTGCKDLSANYQTNYNQISITDINLGPGTCPDPGLQEQEESMIALLRSARSYFVADTTLQIAGDAGFLNYSLTPLNRPEVAPPQASIQVVPQAQVGQVVVFDGSASSGQAPLVAWKWDFGDGATASGVVVQHTYTTAGTFNVRLTVTDQRNLTGSSTTPLHILALPTPTLTPTVAPPSATPPLPTLPPQQPTYTPEPTAEPPTETPEPPPAPEPPVANISAPGRGFIGEPVQFDASASQPGSSPISSFRWSLGNGEEVPASTESRITAIYNRAGDYEVTVFVTDGNGMSSFATTRIRIDARLDTSVWTLSTINAGPLLPGTAITMQFKQGELAGFAGCNTYHGEYTANLNEDGSYTIAIGPLTTGRLACPQDIMEQEQEYLTRLQGATRATVQENQISLESPPGSLVFYLIVEK